MLAIGVVFEEQCTFSRNVSDDVSIKDIIAYMNNEVDADCDEILLIKGDSVINILTSTDSNHECKTKT
jgi:hypothetical protein